MKIQWDTIWLADDLLRQHASGLDITSEQIVQDAPKPRQQFQDQHGRKNEWSIISFTVHRDFSTVQAAEEFCALHFSTLPVKATLRLRTGAVGENAKDMLYENAVKVRARCRNKGKSVEIAYLFRAGSVAIDSAGFILTTEAGEPLLTEAGDKLKAEST